MSIPLSGRGMKMTRNEFLQKLGSSLKGLPSKDITEILSDYEEHFRIGMEKVKSEEEISAELGDIGQIAAQFKAEAGIETETIKKRSTVAKVFIAIGMIFFNLIFVAGIYFGLLGTLIGLFAGSIGTALGGLGGLLMLILYPLINVFITVSISNIPVIIFGSIGTACLGTLWFIGNCIIAKYFIRISIMYFKWNMKVING